ncbi:flagellin [Halobacillus sp. BAB-2008]|uniref:flagellin N-terminal helical domain-containing protein n=1 Tax=Halobacillus sp. BAB-2008 TaxID=1246484 RepID=UPI0002A4DE4F|nr:flagellin [Halobacillus sp. BAB-2008]ELK46299.1 flagellin [Halobacillus sp. BAB-2008]
MRINHNIAALNTYRQLGDANKAQQNSMEKLSSGLRINSAKDDAAGLAISEKMRGQIKGLDMASKNAQDGISLIQTAEGALNETHSILQRMRELAVQSANDTNTDVDRAEIQKEVNQLSDEITRIGQNTEFNTQNLTDGSFSGKFQIGSNSGQNIELNISDMRASVLGVQTVSGTIGGVADTAVTDNEHKLTSGSYTVADNSGTLELSDAEGNVIGTDAGSGVFEDADGNTVITIAAAADGDSFSVGGIDVSTQDAADSAITTIQTAIETVSSERSKLGAVQNRLDHTINNLSTSSENLTAAESRIRDVDMAKEMMEQTKNSILSQASQAMLAQANQQPQGVLQLLR